MTQHTRDQLRADLWAVIDNYITELECLPGEVLKTLQEVAEGEETFQSETQEGGQS